MPPKPPPTLLQRAVYRWSAVTTVLAAFFLLYTQHPYYLGGQFAPWRSVFPTAFALWLVFGFSYVKATLARFSERRYVMRDGALHLLLLAKVGYRDVLSRGQWRAVTVLAGTATVLGTLRAVFKTHAILRSTPVSAAIFLCGAVAIVLVARGLQPRRIARLLATPRVRTTVLGICVKAFFTPLMTGFVVGHVNAVSRAWAQHKGVAALAFKAPAGSSVVTQLQLWWREVGVRIPELLPNLSDVSGFLSVTSWTRADLTWGLALAYDLVFLVDCGWALAGYASESRWLGNKTRSVEPTGLGWVVCLACYPPFNNVLGTYLPLETGPAHFTSENVTLAFKAATVGLFTIYAAATVSFGWKFSNLTNRGIVTRGPYRFLRHPAYVCKCSAWWLEHIPTLTLTKAFFLSLLCGVYALRAWTEERHLSRDPDYRAYKKRTPWVLIPGVY